MPTVRLNAWVLLAAVGLVESVTVSEKVNVPAAVGVPLSDQFVPEPPNANHEGSEDPLATVQV